MTRRVAWQTQFSVREIGWVHERAPRFLAPVAFEAVFGGFVVFLGARGAESAQVPELAIHAFVCANSLERLSSRSGQRVLILASGSFGRSSRWFAGGCSWAKIPNLVMISFLAHKTFNDTTIFALIWWELSAIER